MLVINPDECIDCGLCEPECPVDAIVVEDDLPEKYKKFLAINKEFAQKWPNITHRKDPPPDADEWNDKKEEWNGEKDKLKYLEE